MTISVSSRKVTPDTLTVMWLTSLGWTVDHCQRQMGVIKRDLHGFADQHAFAGPIEVLIQTTTASNMASRRKKVIAHPNALKWKRGAAHRLIFIIGWKDRKGDRVPRMDEIVYRGGRLEYEQVSDPVGQADVRHYANP